MSSDTKRATPDHESSSLASIEALRERLTCRNGSSHYCPNCDNSIGPELLSALISALDHVRDAYGRPPMAVALARCASALSLPRPGGTASSSSVVPLPADERTRLHRLLQHAYAVLDPDEHQGLLDGIFAETGHCENGGPCQPPVPSQPAGADALRALVAKWRLNAGVAEFCDATAKISEIARVCADELEQALTGGRIDSPPSEPKG